jgi:hypothetical protein
VYISCMVYVLTSNNEFEKLKAVLNAEIKGLEKEIKPIHSLTFNQTIQRKIELINSTLETIESNPCMTMQELADLIDYRIEGEERELDDATSIFETDKNFIELRILEWIRFTVRKIGQLMSM